MDTDRLMFFDRRPEALPLYEKLEQCILSEIPDVKIKTSKTQIGFSNKRGFAYVSFVPCRKAKERPKAWLTVTFGLEHRCASPRIDAATEPYPNRWTHHVMVGSVEEIDDELLGWLRQAAAFSAKKR